MTMRPQLLSRTLLSVTGVFAVALIAIGAQSAPKQGGLLKERYLSPIEMVFSADGRMLYVVCQDSDEVRVVDPDSGKVTHTIPVGKVPRGIALATDGKRLYVSNASSDSVSVIDTTSQEVIQTLPTGFEPSGVVTDRDGSTLYVANRLSSDISVIDLKAGTEIKRLSAGQGASYISLSSDGKWIYATHIYPNRGPARTAPESEITVIDTSTQRVVERKNLHN